LRWITGFMEVFVKGRYLISLLLPLLLLSGSCTQQTEKKALPEKVAREKPAAAKKPLKIIHVAGEMVSVSPKAGKLTVRGKDGEAEIYATKKTIIYIGRDKSRLSDIAAGDKVTVKYLEIDGKNVARSIFIVREAPDDSKSPKAEIPSIKPSEKITPDQPADSHQKAWPSS
jgi:Cu/Ag efflux protein CusF